MAANIIKDTDNRGGTIIQTSINKYLVFKPKKLLQKTFQKQKYYQHLSSLLNKQLERKIELQKNNKKYIPEVFLELNNVKENLRYITQPTLFYKKDIEELKGIEFHFFNEVFEKFGFERKEIFIDDKLIKPKTINDVNKFIEKLTQQFQQFKETLPNLDDREELKLSLPPEQYELLLKEQVTHRRFERFINSFEKKFDLLNKKFILLTEKAGQGKTNLICDFVDNVMLEKGLLGLMFTGNEFNNLDIKAIEDVILQDVYGFESAHMTFEDFLNDIDYLSKFHNSTFTIVIDGLNENSNIEHFSQELYNFVEKILEKSFIRLIFTCRSEYFDERFTIFKEPTFKNNMFMMGSYMNRYHHQNNQLPEYFEDRLLNAYFKFFQVENTIFDNVRHQLSNDFLLLRIFCEVYGRKTNVNPPIEQVYDIYKDDLFKRYFEYKKEQLQTKTDYSLTDFQQLFNVILSYMIGNNKYINIPFEKLNEINLELLNYIIDEDIFFRRDLIKDETSVLANKEVLNFTFDEFIDYLLADYLSINDSNIEEFINSINSDETSIEGIEKYLFFKSRKSQYREKLKFLENLEYYDDLFLDNIFSVKDEDISEEDIQKIIELFKFGYEFSKDIIYFLMFRHRTKHYKNLNIFILFEIIFSLNSEEYSSLVNQKFKIKYDYSRNRNGDFLELLQQLKEILDKRDFSKEYQLHNIFEFMILLLGVEDESKYGGCPYELIDLLENYIDRYPTVARVMLLKYRNIKIDKVKENIWKLLDYYSNTHIDFDKELCQEIFFKMESEQNDTLIKFYQFILEKCYKDDNEQFTQDQKEFFKSLEKQRDEQKQLFQDLKDGKVDYTELFKVIE